MTDFERVLQMTSKFTNLSIIRTLTIGPVSYTHLDVYKRQPEAVVDGRRVVAFCSNDYLGLANHPALVAATQDAAGRWGVGSGASHVVSGHLRPHEELEERLAVLVGRERALYFTTGYMANLAIVPTLVERRDAIFADRCV